MNVHMLEAAGRAYVFHWMQQWQRQPCLTVTHLKQTTPSHCGTWVDSNPQPVPVALSLGHRYPTSGRKQPGNSFTNPILPPLGPGLNATAGSPASHTSPSPTYIHLLTYHPPLAAPKRLPQTSQQPQK